MLTTISVLQLLSVAGLGRARLFRRPHRNGWEPQCKNEHHSDSVVHSSSITETDSVWQKGFSHKSNCVDTMCIIVLSEGCIIPLLLGADHVELA